MRNHVESDVSSEDDCAGKKVDTFWSLILAPLTSSPVNYYAMRHGAQAALAGMYLPRGPCVALLWLADCFIVFHAPIT